MSTRYPNADTSAERLEDIQRSFSNYDNFVKENNLGNYPHMIATIRNLLAMIEERDATIIDCGKRLIEVESALNIRGSMIDELRKTLAQKVFSLEVHKEQGKKHYWRKWSEEKPELNQIVQMRFPTDWFQHYKYMEINGNLVLVDDKGHLAPALPTHWRLIPPVYD